MIVTKYMEDQINKKDMIIATIIAIVLGVTFWNLSSGLSLKVTFIPGLVLTYAAFVWMFVTEAKLPSSSDFFPSFFLLLAVQFIHFAEEFATGFTVRFPELYGGHPYSERLFVIFNMASYSIFSVGCILALTRKLRFLIMPALFFIIYGALGNAISHTFWSLHLKAYFPGLISAQIYWVAGPIVLYKLIGNRRAVTVVITVFVIVLAVLLNVFAVQSP